jgi:hypothetical protein
LAFVDAGHEFKCRNGVFAWYSVEIWELDDLSFHSDVGVGLNLSLIVSLKSGGAVVEHFVG